MKYPRTPSFIHARSIYYAARRRILAPLMDRVLPRGDIGVLPGFLIVGGMKCGTTSLYSYLCQHPAIEASSTKEVGYFSILGKFAKGERWYRSHFPDQKKIDELSESLGYPVITGEATPSMHVHHYARHASRLLPDARIIMILRNPVDRAYSHYTEMRRNGVVPEPTFRAALKFEKEHMCEEIARNVTQPARITALIKTHTFVLRGQYLDQIRMWLNYYDRAQLLILNAESMFDAPEKTCNRIASFLGLPRYELSDNAVCNIGHYKDKIDPESEQYLTEYFRSHNKRLFEFLGEDWGWPS